MDRRITLAMLIAVLVVVSVPLLANGSSADESDPYGGGDFLVDYGNGRTLWIPTVAGLTVEETVGKTLQAHGISYSSDFSVIDGMSSVTIGGADTGGTLSSPGTTGDASTSGWTIYQWGVSEWETVEPSAKYMNAKLAVGFYPEGIIPVETPEYRSSWTSIQGDSWNTANQTAIVDTEGRGMIWSVIPEYGGDDPCSAYGGILVARNLAILKYGSIGKSDGKTATVAYNLEDGSKVWEFKYKSTMDTTSAAIMGQYVYIQGNNGLIYKFDWRTGPNEDYSNVTTFGGAAWDDTTQTVPSKIVDFEWYVSYKCNVESLVADSGCLYCKAVNGMTYCFDSDLNLLWAYLAEGPNYYTTPTVYDGMVFSGCYDGTLYVLDQEDGSLIAKQVIYQTESRFGKCGAAGVPIVMKKEGGYDVFIPYTDGLGMDSRMSGIAVYSFDGSSFTLVRDLANSLGGQPNYSTMYDLGEGNAVIVAASSGVYYLHADGSTELISSELTGQDATRNTPVLVNGHLLYVTTYTTHKTVTLDLSGKMLGGMDGISNYSMVSPVVVDGYSLVCDDNGVQVYYSTYPEYAPPEPVPTDDGAWKPLLYIAIGIIVFLAVLWAVLRFGLKWEHPFSDMRAHIMHFFFGTEYTHNKRSKRKVRAVVIFGVAITFIVALVSLCVGPEVTLSIQDAIHYTISAIQKGGHNLGYEEMLIYNQRLPRVLAAIGVGVGLSVAGAMYQAVIKNPLVEPYIMGVSSGAGTFAVAVLTFDFTFFGLFAANSIYLTAFSAIFGGLLAFGLTMLLALKTGGKSINYVLAGIVIGLVFAAVQSLLMIDAGTKVASALSWLYGSFSTMTWDKLWLVLVPSLFLSIIPLVWAKEFNLVLLGEDQAKQMGLNAKRFDAIMLIIASVLTSFCVAFVGIIGFVGLVIPHLSRMILGGDHRLMLPATMAFGGFLMVSADLLARVLLSGYELPVGAITTVIGVPVFAYLLIKRGRSYDV